MDYSIIENLAVAFIQSSRGAVSFHEVLGKVSFRKISREVKCILFTQKIK